MKNDKNSSIPRYNLRRIKGRNYYTKIHNIDKIKKPEVMRYNLRTRKPTQYGTTRNIMKHPLKYNTINTNKNNKGGKNNVNNTDDVDDVDNVSNTEHFSWDNFNVYESANEITNISNNDKRDWVSATGVKNYLMREPLIDWFDLHYLDKGYNENLSLHQPNIPNVSQKINLFLIEKNKKEKENNINDEINKQHTLFEMGIKFEEEVIKYLKNKYCGNVKTVVTANSSNEHLDELTLKYMMDGVPIIEQAAMCNLRNKTYGIADILIRSDWINRLFEHPILSEEEEHIKANNLNGNYHYRVIDIKWTTMYLCSNGKTLRNSHRFPAYKGQLAIYNAALGNMQGYTPDEAYILSKSWNLCGGQNEGFNCFSRLGHIDFMNFDNKYIRETHNAIKWIRDVRYNGYKWTCNTPSVPELYPNMCNRYDAPYHKIKKDLADKLKEITQIWMVGVKHRKIAHNNNIYSWDDPKCNSKTMGINGKKIGPTIDKIIQINRHPHKLIEPPIIKNNIYDWKRKSELDFYVDFESVNGCLYNKDINLTNSKADSQLLFMIGVGYEENNKWVYKSFITTAINRDEEYRIMNEFINFIDNKIEMYVNNNNIKHANKCYPRFFHWSPAEKTIIGLLNKRHNNQFYNWQNKIIWIDVCKIFVDEPIVIKGAKKFNLKDIAKTMVSHGMITSEWNFNGPENGLDAMFEAIDYYKFMENPNKNMNDYNKNIKSMTSITNYNEIDCKVVYEIVNYLRNNH